MSWLRILGLDRSGPLPSETRRKHPLHPWTVPNAIVFARLALIPVFLAIIFSTEDGHSTVAAWLYFGLALSDYADGLIARLTGQFSRLGALLDPLSDRLLALSGFVVCWHFDLLPHWILAIALGREVVMVGVSEYGLKHGIDVKVNWPGRIAVFFVFGAVFWAVIDVHILALIGIYVGTFLSVLATVLYIRYGVNERARQRKNLPKLSS